MRKAPQTPERGEFRGFRPVNASPWSGQPSVWPARTKVVSRPKRPRRGPQLPNSPSAVKYLLGIALLLAVFFPSSAAAAIRYEVSLDHPEQHLFHVTMEVPEVHGEVKLQMAAWNALYEIRDFSSHVQQVQAFANGHAVEIEKLNKLTWDVKATGTVTVKYATFWDDVGPFNSQLNSDHAFINPAMILLYVPERRSESSTIFLSNVPADWKVASASLADSTDNPSGTFRFEAPSFDTLTDDPIEVSNFDEFTIHDLSPPVHVIIHGDNYKKHEVESALRKICTYELKLMNGAPYNQYTFIFHIGKAAGGGGGGMEHSNSTAIYIPSGDYLANVSAHEYFHLWNVKRIRPASLEPVDYTQEMYTRALWFAEGVTNTYGSYRCRSVLASGTSGSFIRIFLPRSANWKPDPPSIGRARNSQVWTRGSINTACTIGLKIASPTTPRDKYSACCWTLSSAIAPTTSAAWTI